MPCYVIISVNWKEDMNMQFIDNFKEKFDGWFTPFRVSDFTPDDLITFLQNGKAFLAVEIGEDNKCILRSYAWADDEIIEYIIYYKLLLTSLEEDKIFETDDVEIWHREFEKYGAYLTEDIAYIERLGDNKQILFENLSGTNKRVFITDAQTEELTFIKNLEINFMEPWLALNPEYYV